MASALETIQQIYGAFGRGDIPAIIDQLHEEVKWESWENNTAQAAGVPWLRGGSGKRAATDFFGYVATMKFEQFQVLGMLANDHQVAVEVLVDAVLPNGRRLRDEEIHLWNLNAQGKVVRFRHYLDTAKAMAAAAG